MSHHKQPSRGVRVFIACSPSYHNRRAIMEALGSIFIDTIEEQREYYYFECPAMTEIFDDGALNRTLFRELVPNQMPIEIRRQTLKFTHIVAGGDDTFVAQLLADVGSPDAVVMRLA